MTRKITPFLLGPFYALVTCAAVPTAEEYAHSLELRFTNGESAASIRASFATNGIFSFCEIMPYCYDYCIDTNDLAGSVSRYKAKHEFIGSLLPDGPIEVSSNIYAITVNRLKREEMRLSECIYDFYSQTPSPDCYAYWNSIWPKAFSGLRSGPPAKGFRIAVTHVLTKDMNTFFRRIMLPQPRGVYDYVLNLDNYTDVFSRADLYAELSSNKQYNADAMFKYCLTEKSDFATNNIAIAEKQIWRNNFVLDIVTHSCNLHTNDKNRAYNAAYTNKLTEILAHYETISEPHLGMAGVELNEWRTRLRDSIRAYVESINPFRPSSFGE